MIHQETATINNLNCVIVNRVALHRTGTTYIKGLFLKIQQTQNTNKINLKSCMSVVSVALLNLAQKAKISHNMPVGDLICIHYKAIHHQEYHLHPMEDH